MLHNMRVFGEYGKTRFFNLLYKGYVLELIDFDKLYGKGNI